MSNSLNANEAPTPGGLNSTPPPSGLFPCNWHPWFPWVAPFALYILIMSAGPYLPISAEWNHILRLLVVTPIVLFCSRKMFSARPVQPVASILVGIVVFALWVGPDLLFPEYRHHWLLSNSITGAYDPVGTIEANRTPVYMLLRILVSVLLVPVIEELFWRGFVMRILIKSDFLSVPMGTYAREAFWITAILFAVEHGAYWDVGLLAGIAYNAWLVRTRSLADTILAHAVTNGLLAVYVIVLGKWVYWP